jgi:putative ubiquitin-RnfH superfamily antitoxin RatB of RatAB toxin-antitoxin module
MMMVSILLSGRLKIDGYGQGHPMNDDSTFQLALRDGSTVRDAIRGMGVPSERVTMTMINGRKSRAEANLKPGDRVILIPEDVAILWRALTRQNLEMGIGFDS